MRQQTPLLELRGISKRFGAVQVLHEVDFEVHARRGGGPRRRQRGRQVDARSSRRSAGHPPPGRGRSDGTPASRHLSSPSHATALGIATVYQDLALCDNLDVVANLYLGHARTSAWPSTNEDRSRDASVLLRRLAVSIPSVRIPVASLSGGQRQSVAVARATMGRAEAGHPRRAHRRARAYRRRDEVLHLIKRLRDERLGVVVISHNLVDVFEVADRIIVLAARARVATLQAADSTADQVVAAMTGRQTSTRCRRRCTPGITAGPEPSRRWRLSTKPRWRPREAPFPRPRSRRLRASSRTNRG